MLTSSFNAAVDIKEKRMIVMCVKKSEIRVEGNMVLFVLAPSRGKPAL